MKGLLLLALLVHCAYGAHDLNEEYRFSADLSPSYKLHWSFDLQAGTIAFAVNVSTTGWVGFGLSPNGQMPGSDVIIGWVDQTGEVQFKVRINSFICAGNTIPDMYTHVLCILYGHVHALYTLTTCTHYRTDTPLVDSYLQWTLVKTGF